MTPIFANSEWGFLVSLIIGIGFGISLEQGGLGNTRKLIGVFYGYDFTVIRVFFSAAVTAMVGLFFLSYLGMVDWNQLYINPLFMTSLIVGGVIMGFGFIIGGYCPGTSTCAAATGRIDAMIFVVGVFLGSFLFGEFYPLLKGIYYGGQMGSPLVHESLGISQQMFIGILLIALIGVFAAVGFIQKKVSKPENKY